MRKILFIGLCVLTIGIASAQETKKLGAGDYGLTTSVSSSTSTIGGLYHLTDSIVLAPELGFSNWNDTITASQGASANSYSGYWVRFAVSGYYELKPFKNLYVDVGPQFNINVEPSYKNDGSNDEWQWNYWGLQANVAPKLMLNDNFAVFSVFGVQYHSTETKNVTTGNDTVKTGINLSNANLGIIYYLR